MYVCGCYLRPLSALTVVYPVWKRLRGTDETRMNMYQYWLLRLKRFLHYRCRLKVESLRVNPSGVLSLRVAVAIVYGREPPR